ncbi:MAG TPA: hypothetical protein PKC87_00565 [Candidatus Absconditabacterales bacterium]|nr:hypothetical protein [Candidatus Absconditabacterales bacterium]
MTLKDLIDLAGERDLAKSYPKADGVYVWDYKVLPNKATNVTELHLIPSDSGKAGFKDKVSIDELVNYVLEETDPEVSGDEIISQLQVVGAEGITIAKI